VTSISSRRTGRAAGRSNGSRSNGKRTGGRNAQSRRRAA
jgi:hypothetical protein